MSPWPFIIAAYALTIGGGGALILVSFHAMRRAEQRADALRRDKP